MKMFFWYSPRYSSSALIVFGPRFLAPLLMGLISLAPLQAQSSYPTPYTFTTFAGRVSIGSADGTGSVARFDRPMGVAADGTGNVYVADNNNNTIRKITPAGVVTTIAGMVGYSGSTDGVGVAARFNNPSGVAVDGTGNVYVADTNNNTIRKITPAGLVTTIAGSIGISGRADGIGSAAQFSSPAGVAVDATGIIYVADTQNSTIRKVTSDGAVTTFAGNAILGYGWADGTGSAAQFGYPKGLTVDSVGNVYVADTSSKTIRKITSAGAVTTLAGSPYDLINFADGTGSAARFYEPSGIAVDGAGSVYVADSLNRVVRKITPAGIVTTLAGERGDASWADGTGSAARFVYPLGVAVDGAGNVYVADTTIRKITTAGVVTTHAGTADTSGSTDGAGALARFNNPQGVAADAVGNIYVADTFNHTIRKITLAGVTTTFAGKVGVPGSTDGAGTDAQFAEPYGVAVDGAGNVYVADTKNSTVRKITPAGVVTTLAGNAGVTGAADGTGATARFYWPRGVAVDGTGNVYVADTFNFTIRKITSAGVVTTLAGTPGSFAGKDFGSPSGIAVDISGNVYVGDGSNYTILKITSAGVITTLAGSAGNFGLVDGTGSGARFVGIPGMALDGAGNVYVTSTYAIRKMASNGNVTTLAGIAESSGSADGIGRAARFLSPTSLTVDNFGNVYVADGNSIRKGSLAAVASAADFNGDGKSDILFSNTVTGDRAMWLMNGMTVATNAFMGTVSANWIVSGTGDFDGDGKRDIFWTNTATGDRAAWLMNGSMNRGGDYLGTVPVEWIVSGTGDFDGDGKADLLWTNTVTGERAVWLMNGLTRSAGASLGVIPVEWIVSGVGDFNADGKADVLLSNTATGDRAMWLMNGAAIGTNAFVSTVSLDWTISGIGDFNGDGRADLFWTNALTGDRVVWLMNGSASTDGGYVGAVPVEWIVSGVGDFNGDKKADLVWSNIVSGERAIWLMNGVTTSNGSSLGVVPLEWKINH